jgi:hypothetical protein
VGGMCFVDFGVGGIGGCGWFEVALLQQPEVRCVWMCVMGRVLTLLTAHTHARTHTPPPSLSLSHTHIPSLSPSLSLSLNLNHAPVLVMSASKASSTKSATRFGSRSKYLCDQPPKKTRERESDGGGGTGVSGSIPPQKERERESDEGGGRGVSRCAWSRIRGGERRAKRGAIREPMRTSCVHTHTYVDIDIY